MLDFLFLSDDEFGLDVDDAAKLITPQTAPVLQAARDALAGTSWGTERSRRLCARHWSRGWAEAEARVRSGPGRAHRQTHLAAAVRVRPATGPGSLAAPPRRRHRPAPRRSGRGRRHLRRRRHARRPRRGAARRSDGVPRRRSAPRSTDQQWSQWRELEERHFSRYLAGQLAFQEQRRCRVREFTGEPLDDAAGRRLVRRLPGVVRGLLAGVRRCRPSPRGVAAACHWPRSPTSRVT